MRTAAAQRQDSLTDQMFDVMTTTAHAGNRAAANLLCAQFFAAAHITAPLSAADGLAGQIRATDQVAIDLGCYDASDWIRRHMLS